jgi:RHS repeat-associated protein
MVYDAGGKLVAEYGQAPIYGNYMLADIEGGTHYVFADHQGSTRAVIGKDSAGQMTLSRHDYQPFGGEIYSGIGMRNGYGSGDSVRQKYAGMEMDEASGMAHTLWRKYDLSSGRWTSPDPYGGSMTVGDPQSFNRYSYANNDPVNQTDPSGLIPASQGWNGASAGFWGNDVLDEGHWGGKDDIAQSEARHDSWVQEAMALKAEQDAWNKGDYDACRKILAANPSVGYEVNQSQDKVEVEQASITTGDVIPTCNKRRV